MNWQAICKVSSAGAWVRVRGGRLACSLAPSSSLYDSDSDAAAVDGLDRAYGDHDLFTGAASPPASLGLEAAVRDALMASKAEELKNEGLSPCRASPVGRFARSQRGASQATR